MKCLYFYFYILFVYFYFCIRLFFEFFCFVFLGLCLSCRTVVVIVGVCCHHYFCTLRLKYEPQSLCVSLINCLCNHYEIFAYTHDDFLLRHSIRSSRHSLPHAGIYGCDNLNALLTAGYITDETSLKYICNNWIFYLQQRRTFGRFLFQSSEQTCFPARWVTTVGLHGRILCVKAMEVLFSPGITSNLRLQQRILRFGSFIQLSLHMQWWR